MKKSYRILIAIGVTLAAMFLMVFLWVFFVDRPIPKFMVAIPVFAGFTAYRLIKPGAVEIERNTKLSHVYYENGMIKEKGKIIDGHREGAWDFFDEQGGFVETKNYKSGKEV